MAAARAVSDQRKGMLHLRVDADGAKSWRVVTAVGDRFLDRRNAQRIWIADVVDLH